MNRVVLASVAGLVVLGWSAVVRAADGDTCAQPYVVALPGLGLPFQHAGTTCGHGNDAAQTCLGVLDDGEDVFYQLVLAHSMVLEIVVAGGECCGMALLSACPPDEQCLLLEDGSSAAVMTMHAELAAGVYYLLLDGGPYPNCAGYTLTIGELAAPAPGDSCGHPLVINVPADLPFQQTGATTCGRHDFVNAGTCLGYYANGEEAVYQLHVTAPTEIDVYLDPRGTDRTGLLLDTECPPSGVCVAYVFNTAAAPREFSGLVLPVGDYTILVDKAPLPNCIPAYDFEIRASTAPHGACCIAESCVGTWSELTCLTAGGRWFRGWPCDGFTCAATMIPVPDTCETAHELPAASCTRRLLTATAAPGLPPGTCNSPSAIVMQNDTWFTFVSTGATLTLGLEYLYNGITAVYTGPDCASLTPLACVDSGYNPPDTDTVEISVPAGERVWVQVGDYGTGPGGGDTYVALLGGASLLPGDANCDGAVSFGDINPFVLLLANPEAWQQSHPGCSPLVGDVNVDGAVGFGDINPFVALLASGG
jgi:hypothetical protein